MLPHHFQQAANFAITLVNHQAATFAMTGLHFSKQAARMAAAPFQRGASSAITLLHPSIKQPVLLPPTTALTPSSHGNPHPTIHSQDTT